MEQTVPDAMHTVKDVIESLFSLITGKKNNQKVQKAEEKLGRFHESIPYMLSKTELKIADNRFNEMLAPIHADFIPTPMFQK